MANTNKWQRPGDCNLIELSIVIHNNTKLDIADNAVQIDIFESLTASAMTGIIIFQDDKSILETYNIVGSEKIIFKMSTSVEGFHTIEKTFVIAKISDFISQGKEQYYTLHLVTPIAFVDKNFKISKSYDDYAENIINTIYKDTMGFEDDIISDATKYPRKIVVPKMTPLSLFNYLAESSVDGFSNDDTEAGFIFYESSVGFNFRYLRGLYEEGEPFDLYEKGKNLNTFDNPKGKMDIVIEAYLPTMFNNSDNQMLGVFGNTTVNHDIINKTLVTTEYGYSGSLAPNVDDYSTNNRFSFMSNNYDGHTSGKWNQTVDGDNQRFDNFNVVLNIYGNSNITVGQTVNYKYKTNVLGSDNKDHLVFPKKYLITNIRHSFLDGVYNQSLELSSDRWYE